MFSFDNLFLFHSFAVSTIPLKSVKKVDEKN